MKCPICESENVKRRLSLHLARKDDTTLKLPYCGMYKLWVCNDCTHLYNELSDQQVQEIESFYQSYLEGCLDSEGNVLDHLKADIPGSESPQSSERYKILYEHFLQPFDRESNILDYGCSQGGFLSFLAKKGFRRLYGVDLDQYSIELARRKKRTNILLEHVQWLDHGDPPKFDIIVLDQVLEHVVEAYKLIMRLKNCLKPDGAFVISVPDAAGYRRVQTVPGQHLALIEHVHHFTLKSLCFLMGRANLKMETHVPSTALAQPLMRIPMVSAKFVMENNYHKHNRIIRCDYFYEWSQEIEEHVREIELFSKLLRTLVTQSSDPVVFWGASRELIFFGEQFLVQNGTKVFIVDKNEKKQGKKVKGVEILSPTVLFEKYPQLRSQARLIVTAIGYEEDIAKEALCIGFPENRIVRLSQAWTQYQGSATC